MKYIVAITPYNNVRDDITRAEVLWTVDGTFSHSSFMAQVIRFHCLNTGLLVGFEIDFFSNCQRLDCAPPENLRVSWFTYDTIMNSGPG